MSVAAIAAEIRRIDPSISEEEAMALAQSEMTPPNRLDGAPDVELSELESGSPLRRQYRYDSGTGQTSPTTSDEEFAAEIKRDNSESGRYGSPWGTTDGFTSQQAADAYRYRAPGMPSQQDIDMLESRDGGTGFVEVYDPVTGRTSLRRRAPSPTVEVVEGQGPTIAGEPIVTVYRDGDAIRTQATESPFYRMPDYAPGQSTAAYRYMQDLERGMRVEDPMPEYMDNFDWGGVELGWANEATGNQRVGPEVDNRDVMAEMPAVIPGGTRTRPKPAYDMVPTLGEGPMGPVVYYGYRPETEKERLEDYREIEDERALRRAADRAGISMAEARAMKAQAVEQNQADPMQQIDPLRNIRDLAMDRRNEDRRAREQAVRSRNMLAGNDPRSNATNAFNMLDEENQQMALLGGMFPQGATPLDVAQAEAAAVRETPLETLMRNQEIQMMREQMEMARDQADPSRVGVRDISSGNYDSLAAAQEFERLAETFDQDTIGMGFEQRDAMSRALQRPPYNMPEGEADAFAYRYTRPRMNNPGEPPGSPGYIPPGTAGAPPAPSATAPAPTAPTAAPPGQQPPISFTLTLPDWWPVY
jgi:hypothetical protein